MVSVWWRIVISCCLLTLFLPDVALAHVEISPDEVSPGSIRAFAIVVPTEKEVPTTGVSLEIPEGFEVVGAQAPSGGWRGSVGDGSVRWSGGEIGAGGTEITSPEGEEIQMGESEEFAFEARALEEPGEYAWAATQTYEDGSAVEWSGPVDSEKPAPPSG